MSSDRVRTRQGLRRLYLGSRPVPRVDPELIVISSDTEIAPVETDSIETDPVEEDPVEGDPVESDPEERSSDEPKRESMGELQSTARQAAHQDHDHVTVPSALMEGDDASTNQEGRSGPSYSEILVRMRMLGMDTYAGGTDPLEADGWLQRLELNLRAMQCPDEYRRDVAVFYLEKDAEDWWCRMEKEIEISNHAEASWIQFCGEFLKEFFPL